MKTGIFPFVFTVIIQCTSLLCAAGDLQRFSLLSKLPEASLVRKKCLACPNSTGLSKSNTEYACEELENRLRYVTIADSEKSKIVLDKSIQAEELIRTLLVDKPSFISRILESLKPSDQKLKNYYQKEMEVANEFVFYVNLYYLVNKSLKVSS